MPERPFDWPLLIDQGEEFSAAARWEIDGVPPDLTALYSTVRAQIRTQPGGDLLLDLSQYVTLDAGGVNGRVEIKIPATVTKDLSSSGEWDLFLDPVGREEAGSVRLFAGRVVLRKAVTRRA